MRFECSVTFLTLDFILLRMDFVMFSQVSFLRKSSSTIVIMAHIGLLFSVYSEMIKKVMPFMEASCTIIIFAFQYFYNPFGSRIFVLIHLIFICARYVLIYGFIF